MYGTCETLCRELAAKYPGDTPLMLVIWSPEDIQALGDLVEAVLKQRNICVVGSESALEKNREILKQIEPLVQ